MNVIVAVLAVFLVTLATQLRQVSTSSIGAGMVMLVTFSSVLTGVLNAYTGLEISLGGISRLKFFGEMTEREDKADEDIIPTAEWPSAGKVELKNISANYDEEFQVLSDVDIIIQPREKIAICGRTGR
jgi:ABC-type multidrug transport system fused ATPase/permease subunit